MDDIAEELTGGDYLFKPLSEIAHHPDFDQEIFAFMATISRMTTATLQTLMERNANG